MPIYFLQFEETRPVAAGARRASVRAWVKAESEAEAIAAARGALNARGLEVASPDAVAVTTRADYFPPCEGLNAFQRAERDGSCFLIEPADRG